MHAFSEPERMHHTDNPAFTKRDIYLEPTEQACSSNVRYTT